MPFGRLSMPRLARLGRLSAVAALTLLTGALVNLPRAHAGASLKTSYDLPGAGTREEFVPGEIVVWFAETVGAASLAATVAKTGGGITKRSAVTPTRVVLSVPEGEEESYAKAYRKLRGVRAAEKNYILRVLWTPDDPLYRLQWHFNKPEFIYAEQGWDTKRGDPGVVVAVVDTGVAYENYPVPAYEQEEVIGSSYVQAPDLAATKFVAGYDFVHDDEHPNDQYGHGTHVAGTIAQTTNNSAYVSGLAHKCSIMPVQVVNYTGGGEEADVADGIDFARKNGAHVINMSLGTIFKAEVLKIACDDAEAAGVVLVAAAGNDGKAYLHYPASFSSVIAAGAVDYDGELTWYSNYGLGQELVAPGGDTLADKNNDGHPDGVLQMTYEQIYDPGFPPFIPETLANVTTFTSQFHMGTSMACPHVAGLAALVIANGVTDNAEVRKVLRGSATDLGTSGYDTKYGYGLINCEAAITGKVRDTGDECGECAQLSLAELVFFSVLFFGSYGVIYGRRRRKS
jgi:serine protease